jgi:hypothetical protein
MSLLVRACIAALALSGSGVLAADIKSPEETYKGYPNRLADIPPGWVTSKPLRLHICFNLKHPVNSPDADVFLKTLYQTITAMPFGVKVRIERAINPVKFAYCASLEFKDWQTNRAYEHSEVFLKYYREVWKPAVTEASEQLLVLDDVASALQ